MSSASNASAFDGGEGPKKGAGVQHVVVLMLENRSFDNALGYLDSHHPFDGLHPPQQSGSSSPSHTDHARESASKAVEDGRRQKGASGDAKEETKMNRNYCNVVGDEKVWPEPKAQFYTPVDPPHSHKEIMEQMYGEGRVPSFPASTTPPKPDMSGFLSWYARRCGEWRYPYKLDADEHHKVMHAYSPRDLPVLSTLAREYAFSDAWFCSMPGPTAPNRQFLHSATSAGHTANSGRPQHQPTLFDMLDAAGRDWRVYYHDVATVMTFSRALGRPDLARRFAAFDADRFAADLARDDFPAYCFVEPRVFDDPVRGLYSNDQHPPHDVRRGEVLLAQVYEALRASPRWESSLLVVLYDEHGGYYDHVAPPYVRSSTTTTTTTTTTKTKTAEQQQQFDFSVLGPRVPAVFVSPMIERRRPPVRPRSDQQHFTHESLLLTLAKMWDLDAGMLEWQHDPAQIATFEWLWQEEGPTAAAGRDSHKEDVRLPSRAWRGLEAECVVFPHEGMDPYEANYEVKWVGWAVAAARFLRDDVQVDHPDVRRWCDDVVGLESSLSAAPSFVEGFQKVVDRTQQRLAAVLGAERDEAKRRELRATPPSALPALLRYLDQVCL